MTANSAWAHLVVVTVPLVLVVVALAVQAGPAAPWPRRRSARRAVPVQRAGDLHSHLAERQAPPPAGPSATGCLLAAGYLLVFWIAVIVGAWQLIQALFTL